MPLPSMIIVIPARHGTTKPCVIQRLSRKALGVNINTWCALPTSNLGDGVFQVPTTAKICPECEAAIKTAAGG